jgi:hypothetical protein
VCLWCHDFFHSQISRMNVRPQLSWNGQLCSFRQQCSYLLTVLYFFLLMLYKTSTCKIFWCAVGFFHIFYSLKTIFCFLFFVFINKNSENSSISQLCFLFVIYLRFIITLVKGMFDLQIDKNKKQKTKNCLQWIKVVKKRTNVRK